MGKRIILTATLALLVRTSTVTEVQGFTHSRISPSHAHARVQVHMPPPVSTSKRLSSQISLSRQDFFRLTTLGSSNDEFKVGILLKAIEKFQARPGTYLMIPVIAALVGWFTNYLAVQMIFYPIKFRGIPLWRREEVPLGLIGWQGIIPCKTKTMSIAMVEMVTSQLLTVSEAFGRLDPRRVAKLLAPRVPQLGTEVIADAFPDAAGTVPVALWNAVANTRIVKFCSLPVLSGLVRDMQHNIDSIFSLQSCVVSQMVQDKTKLGELFRKVGQKELDFLTNSGLWFGFLLGLIQMVVALLWDNPWSLSIGGCIVGLATNWLALKWIFEPINPTKIGPFILQGQFLRRQTEVAAVFSKYFADNILSSPKLWDSILTNPSTTPAFFDLVAKNFKKIITIVSLGIFKGAPSAKTVGLITGKAIENLPNHLHVLHGYVDKTLGLEETLRVKMEAMSAAKFERVLHPIFEEDELTLILAGGVLGLAAGLVQQGLETGAIKLSNPLPKIRKAFTMFQALVFLLYSRIRGKPKPSDEPNDEPTEGTPE